MKQTELLESLGGKDFTILFSFLFVSAINGMKQTELLESLGGKDFTILFSFLFVSATVIVWCLALAVMSPLAHMTCPLLSMF